jgi:hypothetical protein
MVKVDRAMVWMGYTYMCVCVSIERVACIRPKSTRRMINQSHGKRRENGAMSEPMEAGNMKGPFGSHYKWRPFSLTYECLAMANACHKQNTTI